MSRRAVRVGLVGVGLAAVALVPVDGASAQVAVRTCNVPTIAHERTLPARLAGPRVAGRDLPAPDPAPPLLPATAVALPDLDFDGRPDHLVTEPRAALSITTSDTALPLRPPRRGPVAGTPVRATRLGTTTRIVTLADTPARPGTEATVEVWTVRNSCARAWLGRASRWVLGVQPSDDTLLGDHDPTADLGPSQRRALARTIVRSDTARTVLVDQRYHAVLHRDADPSEIRAEVSAMASGRRTPEQLSASLFGSDEFLSSRGGTLDGWVTGLYRQTVGHAPDAEGAAYWSGVAASIGRERAAARFLATPAARRALVAATYEGEFVLGRRADPSGLDRGAALLAAGGWDALQIELLASDEFYLAAQRSNRLRPL